MKKMKWIGLLAAVCVLACMAPVKAAAWSVTIKNNIPSANSITIDCDVYGEHLFWRQIECQTGPINAGTSKTCNLPGAICPVQVICKDSSLHTSYACWMGASCWNVKLIYDYSSDLSALNKFRFDDYIGGQCPVQWKQ